MGEPRLLESVGEGFRLDLPGAEPIEARPTGTGYAVDGSGVEGWSLEHREPSGFVLRDATGAERGQTSAPVGLAAESGVRDLLLPDGRLFRALWRGPREGGFELRGWETSGAYHVARPVEGGGWRLTAEPAADGFEDWRAGLHLFAAEIIDAERRGAERT